MKKKDDEEKSLEDIVREKQRKSNVEDVQKNRLKHKRKTMTTRRVKQEKLKKIDWDLFAKLCEKQCTVSEISAALNVCKSILYERAVEHYKRPFKESYDICTNRGKIKIRDALMMVGIVGADTKMLIFLAKNYLNMSDKTEQTIVSHNEIDLNQSGEKSLLSNLSDSQKIDLLNKIEEFKKENEE